MNIKLIKSFALKVFRNLEIIIVAIMIFVSPLVVDYGDLPKGYEIPKVAFLQIATVILFSIFLLKNLYKTLNAPKLTFDKSLLVLGFGILLIIITSLLSPFADNASTTKLFQSITWVGNQFRFQGAITHILMLLFAYIVYKRGTKKNLFLIFFAFFFSSIIQSAFSFAQLRFFIENDPKAIFEGYYINGTFGQANFYSGRIMLGILSGIFLISFSSTKLYSKKILKYLYNLFFYFFVPLATLVLIVGLIISFSTWGIITSGILVFFLIIYEIINSSVKSQKRNLFGYFFGIVFVLGTIAGSFLLYKQYSDNVDNIRLAIWERIIYISTHDSPLRVFIGYGYDTLGEVFRKFGAFKGLYVDRAHNFFFDVYSQNGLMAVLSGALLLAISTLKFIFKRSNRILAYLFLGTFFWLFRSFIHESGIVNLFDFLVLFAGTLALQKDIKLKPGKFIPHFLKASKKHSDNHQDLSLQTLDYPTPNP